MKWYEDEELWKKLDEFMRSSQQSLNKLLNQLFQHKDEMDPVLYAIIFGGFGKLIMSYNQLLDEFGVKEAFAQSVQAVHNDKRIQGLIQNSIENVVDGKIKQMKGD